MLQLENTELRRRITDLEDALALEVQEGRRRSTLSPFDGGDAAAAGDGSSNNKPQ